MVPLKKDITLSLNRVMEFIFPKKEQYINEKIIFYLRIYTDLVQADGCLSKERLKRAINLLKVVRNMTRNNPFKEEDVYMKRLNEISNEALRLMNKSLKKWEGPYNMKVRLQVAQNICVLRILKRESK